MLTRKMRPFHIILPVTEPQNALDGKYTESVSAEQHLLTAWLLSDTHERQTGFHVDVLVQQFADLNRIGFIVEQSDK